jgi:diaminopimelate epimerase
MIAMNRIIVVALCLLFACGKSEITANDAEKVVRETLAEARTKDVVKIQVRLEKSEMPSAEDVELRRQIEEAIEREAIGRIVVADAGVGHIDISVEVASTADAVPRLRDLLETFGVLERSTVSVASR